MKWHPFKWSTDDHSPAPVQISPITGKAIVHRGEWSIRGAVAERQQLSPALKGWRTRRAGK